MRRATLPRLEAAAAAAAAWSAAVAALGKPQQGLTAVGWHSYLPRDCQGPLGPRSSSPLPQMRLQHLLPFGQLPPPATACIHNDIDSKPNILPLLAVKIRDTCYYAIMI